jgi:hypothetical protein
MHGAPLGSVVAAETLDLEPDHADDSSGGQPSAGGLDG